MPLRFGDFTGLQRFLSGIHCIVYPEFDQIAARLADQLSEVFLICRNSLDLSANHLERPLAGGDDLAPRFIFDQQ